MTQRKNPEHSKELCEKIGLAMMEGQKLQFALAYYYVVFHIVNSKWGKEKAKKRIEYYLSSSMEIIVDSIEDDAPLDPELFQEIVRFKEKRNWLTHEFVDESTLPLIQGKGFELYVQLMEEIIKHANRIIEKLNKVHKTLKP
jgi:hypothetical protein